jgi:hypothetical protein
MIVVSVVLSVTSTIMTIMVKELKLSGYGRESQVAYYAAESGAECALYWVAINELNGIDPGNIVCGNNGTMTVTDQFTISLSPNPGCAIVTIVPGSPILIQSRGYNTCTPGKLKVERGVQVVY